MKLTAAQWKKLGGKPKAPDKARAKARGQSTTTKSKLRAKANDLKVRHWCKINNWAAPVSELKFHPVRKWRFDWAWPDLRAALELNGGTFTGGRHIRGIGYERDCEKIAVAMTMGWAVLSVTTRQFRSGVAFQWLDDILVIAASHDLTCLRTGRKR